jgi:hypothetical protein
MGSTIPPNGGVPGRHKVNVQGASSGHRHPSLARALARRHWRDLHLKREASWIAAMFAPPPLSPGFFKSGAEANDRVPSALFAEICGQRFRR